MLKLYIRSCGNVCDCDISCDESKLQTRQKIVSVKVNGWCYEVWCLRRAINEVPCAFLVFTAWPLPVLFARPHLASCFYCRDQKNEKKKEQEREKKKKKRKKLKKKILDAGRSFCNQLLLSCLTPHFSSLFRLKITSPWQQPVNYCFRWRAFVTLFVCLSVCLSVCLLAKIRENSGKSWNFRLIWVMVVGWHR